MRLTPKLSTPASNGVPNSTSTEIMETISGPPKIRLMALSKLPSASGICRPTELSAARFRPTATPVKPASCA